MYPATRKFLILASICLGTYLFIRYLLPIFFPFLIGAALALAAEPLVRFLCSRIHVRRALAAGIGVSMAFSFLVFLVLVLCGLLLRELRALAGILPDMENTIRSGMDSLSSWLLTLAGNAPAGIRTVLTENVTEFFSGGSALLEKVTNYLLQLASGILSHVPDSFLSIGTAVISSFMISAKLPKIREFLHSRISLQRLRPALNTLSQLKSALGGWLKAQLRLSGVTFLITLLGFFLLRVPYAPLWAVVVALVDAMPILGSGTALIPWSLVSFLQGDRLQAFGLLGIYATAALSRSVLEPRLVGRQLGLDPLVTLLAMYAGYKLFGFLGLLLAPMLAVTVAQLLESKPNDQL